MKRLIVQVNEQKLGMAEREGISTMFSLKEYTQISQVIGELSGMGEDEGKPITEQVTFGGK